MNKGIITTQYCREAGIPRAYLSRLVDEKKLKRVDRDIDECEGVNKEGG